MGASAALFAGSLVVMVAAAALFTNAVEWGGHRLKLAEGATGSLLAAVGTTLPESIVPIVALAGARPGATGIAVGAIVGAPLLLATLGASITGAAAVVAGRTWLAVDAGTLRRDLTAFLVSFGLLIASTGWPRPLHIVLAVGLVALYAGYVRRTVRAAQPDAPGAPDPLHLLQLGRRLGVGAGPRQGAPAAPSWVPLGLQLAAGAGALVLAGDLFVAALHGLASGLRLPALVLSLILVPLATELPETLAGVLWVRSGRDGLALGTIAGAMVLQATVPAAIGLGFTPWRLTRPALVAAAATGAGALLLLAGTRRGRGLHAPLAAVGGAALYLAYLAVAFGPAG